MIAIHRFLATLFGMFWTQCPRCGKEFGGHQDYETDVRMHEKDYRIVCPACAKEKQKIDQADQK